MKLSATSQPFVWLGKDNKVLGYRWFIRISLFFLCFDEITDELVFCLRILRGNNCNGDSRMIALPHSGYRRGDTEADRRLLGGIVAKHGVQCAVVGLPKAPDGLDCKHLRDFIQLYSRAVFVGSNVHAVAFADETFSTLEAARNVSEKSKARLRRDPVRMKQAIDSVCRCTPYSGGILFLSQFVCWDGLDADSSCILTFHPTASARQNAAAVILQDALDILPKFTSDGFD